jgi:hypothetical protein
MTDINFSRPAADPDSKGAEAPSPAARSGEFRWDIIELLFFAYRDFVGDADHELEAFRFGGAHHRVMHFVYAIPDLKVADLLDVCGSPSSRSAGCSSSCSMRLHHSEDRQ